MTTQLDRIEKMMDNVNIKLENHMKNSSENYTDIKIELAKGQVKMENLQDQTNKNSKYISRDKKFKWLATGAMAGTHIGVIAYIKSLFQ